VFLVNYCEKNEMNKTANQLLRIMHTTYIVSSGALNSTHSHSLHCFVTS